MSVQIFPPEISNLFLKELGSAIDDPRSQAALLTCTQVNRQFYHEANSYIFSSLSISTHPSENRLNALLGILNANPDIARHIRSFTIELQDCTSTSECLSAVLKQLCHLRKFGWIGGLPEAYWDMYQRLVNVMTSSIGDLRNFSSLTALHFENIRHFPLSLFSACRQLESLTLINVDFVGFSKIEPETLSDSLFSSLKRLRISGGTWSEECSETIWSSESLEAVRTIMTRAAPTLTTLIVSDITISDVTQPDACIHLKTTVFPVLKSIQISTCMMYPDEHTIFPIFISQFIDYSAPMVEQIQIGFVWEYEELNQSSTFKLVNGWSPIDNILSSPKYPSLKTLDLMFSERYPPLSSESDVRTLLNEILPAVSSRSRTEISIGADSSNPEHQFMGIHVVL